MASPLANSFKAEKQALRKLISPKLRALPSSLIQTESEQITQRVLGSSFFKSCRSVSCFLNMPTGEPDTSTIVSEILNTGRSLFVPRIVKSEPGLMQLLKVCDKDDLETCLPGLWGIREPNPQKEGLDRLDAMNSKSSGLDLILVPGVAFDHSLSRLGHGKGYYDRVISTFALHGQRPLLVALALREQIVEAGSVPMDEHDWKMDLVVTPDEVIGSTDVG